MTRVGSLKAMMLQGIKAGIEGRGAMIADEIALEFYNTGVDIGKVMRHWRLGARTQPSVIAFLDDLIEKTEGS